MKDLAALVLSHTVFLATASDADLQPDVAVTQLEAQVDAIRRLHGSERDAFREVLTARMLVVVGDELDALRELDELLNAKQ